MEGRMGLLFLIVLGAAWANCDARVLPNPELNRKSDVCTLCEEYAAEALDYLNDNKTQSEIIDALHNSCYQLFSFKQQCIELVDYYVPLFFLEIASVQPGELCKRVYLCQSAKISSQVQENSCGFCKDTVSALLAKLNDPDTKLEIMQELLKACNSMEKLAKECKRMVFEYGPLILVNAEKFLKTADICTVVHACPASSAVVSQEASIMEEIPLLSDS
ncbi:Saposin-like type B, region 1 [Sesbania bispinosa]|nr:Saposin-like type B, region 1 [Sesbania bispinosa]